MILSKGLLAKRAMSKEIDAQYNGKELHVEIFLRHIIETLDPNDIPDLISAFAKENFRLVKIINQAGDHIDKIDPISSSPKSKRNPSPKLPH